jgi:hypothetical protein
MELNSYVGKSIIIGLTYLDYEGQFIKREELYGKIIRFDNNGIDILLNNSDRVFNLPPDKDAIKVAEPGEYRFKSTGEVIVDPDFLSVWTIKKPKT